MKIFSIKQDVDAFKFYLQNENDPLSIKAYSYEGEPLASGWTPFSINLFRGKTKLEKSLREDFNASCFDDGLLFVTEDVAEALCKVTDFFEQLPVITDDGRCFYYMNLTRKIPALFFNDRSEIKDMYRSGVYKFNESIVANENFFRDDILSSNYFVTERFLKEFKYDIKGIYFKEVGEV